MSNVLSIDEGTTSARAALYNERGERIAMLSFPLQSSCLAPGWVEQDAAAVWRAQMEATRGVTEQTKTDPHTIAACGIINQRETVVLWDNRTGDPIAPAIVWQCRRTADFCAELAPSRDAARIERRRV
jgi:glycerol kinase